MEIQEILGAISSVGFPAFVALYYMVIVQQEMKKNAVLMAEVLSMLTQNNSILTKIESKL